MAIAPEPSRSCGGPFRRLGGRRKLQAARALWLASPSAPHGDPPCTAVSCPSSSPPSPSARPALRPPRPLPTWAPAASATIHPGVQVHTDGAQCTANFVFWDAANVYLGQAAHCSGTGSSTDTDGCTSASLPVGTPVDITGASRPGTLVYNSWLTMQALGESDADTCAFNDLALVRIDPADVGERQPVDPVLGRADRRRPETARVAGDKVLSFGNSELRGGVTALEPEGGASLGDDGGGWSHTVYTVTPGIPGDSGSAFLDRTGQALGVLSTVAIAPLAGSNGVGDLAHELAYLAAHTSFAVTLANGTEPFRGPLLPVSTRGRVLRGRRLLRAAQHYADAWRRADLTPRRRVVLGRPPAHDASGGYPYAPLSREWEDHGSMIRVLVVDDHPVLRAGLEAVLRAEPGFVCVGVAADGAEMSRVLHRTAPDVVVLDRRLGDEDGLALCATCARSPTRPRSSSTPPTTARTWTAAPGPPGACGAVAKERDIGELFDALRLAVRRRAGSVAGAVSRVLR